MQCTIPFLFTPDMIPLEVTTTNPTQTIDSDSLHWKQHRNRKITFLHNATCIVVYAWHQNDRKASVKDPSVKDLHFPEVTVLVDINKFGVVDYMSCKTQVCKLFLTRIIQNYP